VASSLGNGGLPACRQVIGWARQTSDLNNPVYRQLIQVRASQ
jgi:hypothetical protein